MGDLLKTYRVMIGGLAAAVVINTPFLSWVYGYEWGWAVGFPLGWLGQGLSAFITFFHEIGHTLAGWFYGYVTIPSFDFQHGGGMAWQVTGQLPALDFCLYALLGYAFYLLRGSAGAQAGIAAVILFHVATAYVPVHESILDFMGPGFEAMIASFFLTRAWLDLAPRGGIERFLNALFGFAMIGHIFIEGWALLHDDAMRLVYFEQKGQHSFGDFDKVAEAMSVDFSTVVRVWLGLGLAALLAPWFLFLVSSRD